MKFVSDLRQVGAFSGYSGVLTNKTDRHDITEILLRVVFIIKQTNKQTCIDHAIALSVFMLWEYMVFLSGGESIRILSSCQTLGTSYSKDFFFSDSYIVSLSYDLCRWSVVHLTPMIYE
jgi:hypothetical protein